MNGQTQPIPQTPQPTPTLPAKDAGKRTRRFIYGCCSLFGCSLLLFLALIFIFIGFGGTTENPIFSLFGVSGPEVVNLIIDISNLIFGFLSFAAFVITIIGVFRFATTKKIDKDHRKKSAMLTFGALGVLFILIFLWIFAYLFLKSKQTLAPSQIIVTEPVSTINLTAPVTVKFDARNIPINRRQYQILTYTWDFDDGEVRTGNPLQTKTYEDKGRRDGRFDVKLGVDIREIATGKEAELEFTRIVTITNERARLVIKADPEKGEVPLTVKLDASRTTDPDGEIQSFEWDLDNDGEFDDATGETAEYTFDEVGTYKVSLRVTESDGSQPTEEKTIEVIASLNPVPVIEVEGLEAGTNTLYIGTNYTFSGASSTAPAGNIKSYEWDFGDGSQKKTTRVATHAYDTVGNYEAVLQVTDTTGRVGEATMRIEVKPAPKSPVPEVETNPEAVDGKISASIPIEVEFDASKSSDPDDDLVEFQWDFENDGTVDSHEKTTSHTYDEVGTFEALLTLIDGAGNKTQWKVTIEAKIPGFTAKLAALETDGEVPLTVQFDASGSSYPGKRIVAYKWNFGDGVEERIDIARISHQYTRIGTFTAKVTVVAENNSEAEATLTITVRSISLSACFTATPESGNAPLDVLFDPSCSSGTVSQYFWNFGDLGQSRERKPTFRFLQPGTHSVTLEVSDPQNVRDTFSKAISVEIR